MTCTNLTAGLHGYRRAIATHVLVVGMLGVAAGSAQAQTKAKTSCQDIPLKVAIYAITSDPVTGLPGGLYGDGVVVDAQSGASVYTDGDAGVYAKFQVCNASYDFVLNLSIPTLKSSPRRFTMDFSSLLVPGDVPGYSGPVPAWLLKIPQMASLSRYGNGQLDTMLVGTLESSGLFAYCNNDTPAIECTGTRLTLANKYSDTSVVRVTVAADCSSWTAAPIGVTGDLADPEFNTGVEGRFVAGLTKEDTTRKPTQLASAGQYSMPFTIVLTRTDDGGCSHLR